MKPKPRFEVSIYDRKVRKRHTFVSTDVEIRAEHRIASIGGFVFHTYLGTKVTLELKNAKAYRRKRNK